MEALRRFEAAGDSFVSLPSGSTCNAEVLAFALAAAINYRAAQYWS